MLEKLTRQTVEAVNAAADFIAESFGKVEAGQIEEKFLNGLVSYVDRNAESMLVDRLHSFLPEAGFITEEDTVETSQAEYQWIIDPLDGTTNFLYDVPHFSVSVALMHGDELVLGVVHHVPNAESFYAWKGGGAWCNGLPVRVSTRTTMRQALIGTGFPYHNFEHADAYFEALRTFTEQARGVRRMGSAALDLAYVACGRLDVFFEYGLSSWDVAGGAVLVQEAGGKVLDFGGGREFISKKQMLACNAAVFPDALQVIQSAF
ncbi:MAG: inositol monophosphatase [Bacteroidetes bacterium]|nr:inositol monophosphatase [Bacteroidota bacterium]